PHINTRTERRSMAGECWSTWSAAGPSKDGCREGLVSGAKNLNLKICCMIY
ncbi:unnamed protein product, partial [Nesidiocoris tenuis]